MTVIERRSVDPMAEALARRAAAWGLDDPASDVESLDLMRQITERLKAAERPSREEFHMKLQAYVMARFEAQHWPSHEPEAEMAYHVLVDLACGPEPKPRGKRTVGAVYGACAAGKHDKCPAMVLFNDADPQGAIGDYCTCDCHKEPGKE